VSSSANDFAVARRAMITNQLRPQAVTDPYVLAAMAAVPREDHVGEGQREMAYIDRALTVDGGPMMSPAEVGRLLSELAPRDGERALVIGPGGGYAAAVLAAIGLTVDRVSSLDARLSGPYDVVLIEGAVPGVADKMAAHLTIDGRVGAAIGERGIARLSIGRGDRGGISFSSVADAQVPPLPGALPTPVFQF
jgi:protein-L-isoaspartate(D-aspartate) O-methyltransferase